MASSSSFQFPAVPFFRGVSTQQSHNKTSSVAFPSSLTSSVLGLILSSRGSSKVLSLVSLNFSTFQDFICKALFKEFQTLADGNEEISGGSFFENYQGRTSTLSSYSPDCTSNLKETDTTTGDNVFNEGEPGFWSVIIPSYNRLPILTKCLQALEEQKGYDLSGIKQYEVVVVDDGSTDGTLEFLQPIHVCRNFIKERRCQLIRDRQEDERSGVIQINPGYRSIDMVPTIANDMTGFSGSSAAEAKESEGIFEEETLRSSRRFPHVKVIKQIHAGATRARNLGLEKARGAVIVFIDSDLVVTEDFLRAHGAALLEARAKDGDDRTFTYGRVVNTANFENPKAEKFKLTDKSAAFFATGNVAISRKLLWKAGKTLKRGSQGPFDADFSEYGWEDLELGVRLKHVGAMIKHVPSAIGYHWHPAFSMDQIPKLIEQERQRGRNGVRFFLKHPKLNVRLMTQLTPVHEGIWFLLTLGGLVTEKTLKPILLILVCANKPGVAAAVLSPTLNWHTVQAAKEEVNNLKRQGQFIKRNAEGLT